MTSYYTEKLSAARLRRCYELGGPRVQQYLEAEILYLLSRLRPTDRVLELGCGYGRVALRAATVAAEVVGIDVSDESLRLARSLAADAPACSFEQMEAQQLRFPAGRFDVVACVQNGICAFRTDKVGLLREALRVVRPGGLILISTYADAFWPHRLAWFEAQAEQGLLGPIDPSASRDGTIVCRDGFRSGRATPQELQAVCAASGVQPRLVEVDQSSLWCEIVVPQAIAPSASTEMRAGGALP